MAGVNSLGYARFNRAWVEEACTLPRPRILITFGDSITAAIGRCGVRTCETYSFLLEARLKTAGLNVQVLNMGVGGNDTRNGLGRLARDVLAQKADVAFVLFGGNDAAMVDPGPTARTEPRVPLAEYRANLVEIVTRIQTTGAAVVLGTPLPFTRAYPHANVGAYAANEDINFLLKDYAAAAREAARETGVPLVDTFCVFADSPDNLKLLQDGCHPNAAGQAVITQAVLPAVRQALAERK
jgi:lysophospholipase L1-like esterase